MHSYLGLHQPQMVRLLIMPVLQAPTLMGKASEEIHQVCPESRRKRSLRTRTNKEAHNKLKHNKMTWVHTEHHLRWIEMLSHPPKGSSSTHPTPTRWIHVSTPTTTTTPAAYTSAQADLCTAGSQYCCCTPADGSAPSVTL